MGVCVCVCVGVCICVLGWEGGAAQVKGFELLRTYEDDFDDPTTHQFGSRINSRTDPECIPCSTYFSLRRRSIALPI